MSMPIPEIRECLYSVARELLTYSDPALQDLGFLVRHLAEETKRRPAVTRAPAGCDPVTEETKRAVIEAHRLNPNLRMDQLGDLFNINQGRVSEILHP